jgi:hypothetical protein
MLTDLAYLSIPIPVALFVYYFIVPLLVWRRFSCNLNPPLVPFDPTNTEMPQDVRLQFADAHDELLKLGFRYLQTISVPERLFHQVTVYYAHDADLCIGILRAIHLKKFGQMQRGECSVTFSTNLTEELSLSTSNMRMEVMRFPFVEFFQLPEEFDFAHLYAIHKALLQQRQIIPDQHERFAKFVSNPEEASRLATKKVYTHLAEEGKFVLSPDGTQVTMSLNYAYVHSWRMLQPLKWINAQRTKRRARQMVAELEAGGWLDSRPLVTT